MRGLYIHVPFCVKKCAYCDFYSLPGRTSLLDEYIKAVLSEASRYTGMEFQTMYLGGGTPSLLGAAGLKKLIDGLRGVFNLSGLLEATVEVNPDSVNRAFLQAARETGINRVSIGVQSLSDYELKSAGRVHNAAQAVRAIKQSQDAGLPDISCDVIVGLPGQDQQTLTATLETLTGSGINHLSMYCLSLEEGTPLALNPPADLPSEDGQSDLFTCATALLKTKRFVHYEISNFALKGRECRHNLNYWHGGEYLGLGPSAASHIDGKRFKNRPDLDAYLEDPSGVIEEVEQLGIVEKTAEEAMLRLRLLEEGLDACLFARKSGTGSLLTRLNSMVDEGLLISNDTVYRLPPERVLTSNRIFARVLGD